MAGFDNNVQVSVTRGAPSVGQTGFGIPLWATDEVQAGFTELIRFYTSPESVNADGDLDASTKAAVLAALSTTPRPDRVAVGRVTQIDSSPLLAVDLDAIRAESDDWYGLAIASLTDADNTTASGWALVNGKLFIAESADPDIIGSGDGIAFDLGQLSHIRTGVLYHDPSVPDYPVMVWFGKRLSINPDTRSVNWPNVNLPGVEVDILTDTEIANAEDENANAYSTLLGEAVVSPGRLVDGEPIDTLISADWATIRIQERTVQLLLDTAANDQKIPYTDDGLQAISQPIHDVLDQGVLAGHFEAGTKVVTVPLLVDVPDADVTARIARASFTIRLKGAIEKTDFTGILTAVAP